MYGPLHNVRVWLRKEADDFAQVYYFYSYGTAAWLSKLHFSFKRSLEKY